MEEAEQVVAKIKEEKQNSDVKLGITEVYTTNLEELNTVQVAEAETSINNTLNDSKKVQQKKKVLKHKQIRLIVMVVEIY